MKWRDMGHRIGTRLKNGKAVLSKDIKKNKGLLFEAANLRAQPFRMGKKMAKSDTLNPRSRYFVNFMARGV